MVVLHYLRYGLLISQLSLHFSYGHSALGHAGKIHVMATGLLKKEEKKILWSSLSSSCRYRNSGITGRVPTCVLLTERDYISLLGL